MGKIVTVILTSLYLMTCNVANAQTSVLVCEGEKSSAVEGFGGVDRSNVTITKVDGKVVKAVESVYGYVYTTKKVQDSPGVYSQLLVEKDRIVLRTVNAGAIYDFAISNTGAYKKNGRMSTAKGQCSSRAMAF